MEPRTAPPSARLAAIHELAQAGIPVGVNVAPIIPGLTDHEMPAILQAAADAGATAAGYTVVRLPYGVAPLFEKWLETHFPDRKDKVLNRLRSMRSGKLNDSQWGTRMRGEGIFADQIGQMFEVARRKAGIQNDGGELSTSGISSSPWCAASVILLTCKRSSKISCNTCATNAASRIIRRKPTRRCLANSPPGRRRKISRIGNRSS